MSVPPPDDRRRSRRPPGASRPDGVRTPDPDPLDEPDDLLAPEDDDPGEDEGPEPEGSDLDAPPGAGDDGPSDPGAAPEGAGSDLDEPGWIEDEDEDDDDEPSPMGLDDDEPYALEDEDDEPTTWPGDESTPPSPLEQPLDWSDPGEEPFGPSLSEEDWATLEVDEAGLVPGRVVVGLKEFASLPDLGIDEVVARFDTGQERSRLACLSGDGRLVVGDHPVHADGSAGVLRTRVAVGGLHRTLTLVLGPRGEDPPLVLGRDALEGYFVVDVALAFLRRRVVGGPTTGA